MINTTLSLLAISAVAALSIAACGSSDDASNTTTGGAGDSMTVTISGELAYRERIALIPGGTATITLEDTSKQDVSSVTLADTTVDLGDRQVPIPFELSADVSLLDERGTYTLRATITGPGGDLEWTTDTAILIDITQPTVDLGTVMLVRATSATDLPGDTDTSTDGDATSSPLVGEWTITDIDGTTPVTGSDPTLVFGDDGSLGGNTGCNSFSTTYSAVGDELTIESPIASTLMACSDDLNSQESAVLTFLDDLATFAVSDDGAALTLTSSAGATLVATRV